jgi:enoyl-CoA hydratase/carnithine racemase
MSEVAELTKREPAQIKEPILLREDNEGITTLTLNRPKQYNALSEAMLAALQAELDEIAQNESVRVVVLAAAGKAFCAGHDLKEMRAKPDQAYYNDLFKQCSRMMLSINRLPQPVIAKVQGLVTAAGCQLVATCDLAVALFCSTPAVAVSRNLPRKQALEMLLTGDFIDAQTALQWGLVNRVVPAEALDTVVESLAQTIVSKSAVAVKTGKQMFYRQLGLDLAEAYAYAAEVMACDMMSEDAAEGIDAFIQKRPANWQHR